MCVQLKLIFTVVTVAPRGHCGKSYLLGQITGPVWKYLISTATRTDPVKKKYTNGENLHVALPAWIYKIPFMTTAQITAVPPPTELLRIYTVLRHQISNNSLFYFYRRIINPNHNFPHIVNVDRGAESSALLFLIYPVPSS